MYYLHCHFYYFEQYEILLVFLQQPHPTTWLVCGVWRLERSRGNIAAIRRLWFVWPSTTVCWAKEEEEKRDRMHKIMGPLENVTGVLCVDKVEARV